MITVKVNDRKAQAVSRWPITSGSVGLKVEFQFSSDWDGLTKTAVFRGSGVEYDQVISSNKCNVPHEVLASAGGDLYIGVYGANGNSTIVIPTVWTNAGHIYEGTERSEVDPSDPTPSWADEVQAIAEGLDVSVSKVGSTATITVTKYDLDSGQTETETATVSDGADGHDGQDGIGVPTGGSTGQLLMKESGADYDTKWADAPKEIFAATYGSTSYDDLYDAHVIFGKIVICVYNDLVYTLTVVDGSAMYFSCAYGMTAEEGYVKYLKCTTADVWSSYSLNVATLNSPAFTGTPTAPTASSGTNTTQIATTAFVKNAVDNTHQIPSGGSTGQVLKKQSGTDYDTVWANESGGGGGTGDYDDLTDKPQINSVTLSGNKSASDLGLDQVFWAVDGSTHNDAIHDAYAAGKIVLVEISGRIYQMTEEVSWTKHRFTCADQGTVYWIEVSNDLWDADPTSRAIPVKATSAPSALGTAAVGSSAKYAAENHVHENNIFTATYTKTSATTATCDKTFADIVAAATAGKTVVAVLSGLFPATQTAEISITSATSFNVTAPIGGTGNITITHISDNTISFSQVYGQEEITASGILKGNGAGGVSAAVAGTDYIAPPGSPSAGDVLAYSGSAWAASAPHYVPPGGNLGAVLAKNSGSDYDYTWRSVLDYTPAGVITTGAGNAAKVCTYSFWDDTHYPQILYITLGLANTAASALTLKVNGKGPYPIYIDGAASSATNYTLPAGSYLVYFDGTNFYFDTTGKIPSAMLPVYNGGVS